MFLDGVAPVAYTAPWNQTVGERIVALSRRGAQRRVAYFYEAPDTSTFRYRVFNMIEALNAGDDAIAASWFAEAEVDRLITLLPIVDVLVICRVRYSHLVNHLVSRARSVGCVTIFDCDDLVFDTDYTHLILYTLDQKLHGSAWDHWYASIGRIGATAKLCDRAIVTNAYLAEKLRAYIPSCDVRIVPNFLNEQQLALSSRIHAAKRDGGYRSNNQIHLGYFSGTPTHNKDFGVVADALAKLLARDSRLKLRLVGFMQPTEALRRYSHRIEQFELQDFLNLQILIGGTEFNLIPLQDNPFTNCKSELKYFEAAITGTISLASPTYVYRAAIQDGENGYLVNNTDWEQCIAEAVESRDRYYEMAEASVRHVSARYTGKILRDTICNALF